MFVCMYLSLTTCGLNYACIKSLKYPLYTFCHDVMNKKWKWYCDI